MAGSDSAESQIEPPAAAFGAPSPVRSAGRSIASCPMLSRASSVVAVLALVAAALPAQVLKGTSPPALQFEKVWNDGPQSWDDLAGKVVILDFAQTW